MFRVKLPAQETYRNATRPYVLSSLEGVLNTFNLNKNVLTYFNSEVEASRMIGTTFSKDLRTDQGIDTGFAERQYIEVEYEEAEANSAMDSSHRHITNLPLWYEPITGSSITPLYVTKKINVTINRYFPDRVTAQQFKTKIESGLKGQPSAQFNCHLHYPISYPMVECMVSIYERLVTAGIINKDVGNELDWFKSCCTVPYDIIGNAIGNNACFVFKRLLSAIKLRFEGIAVKEVRKGKFAGQYLVEFPYSCYYTELVEWEMRYPIMVYQQMTDPLYIPEIQEQYESEYPTVQFFEGMAGMNSGERYMGWSMPDAFIFPPADNWRPVQPHLVDFRLQRLATMEDIPGQIVLNLFRFNGEETFWDEKFKAYLKKYHDKVTKRHKNPLYLSLWSDDLQVEDSQVQMDEEGNIVLTRQPSMRCQYRVVLSFDYNVRDYDSDAITDLISCDNEETSRWIIGVLFPYLPLPGDDEYYGRTPVNVCPWLDWDNDVIDRLVPGADSGDGTGRYPANPVVIYGADGMIIAKNEQTDYRKGSYVLDFSASDYLRRK